MVALNRSVAIAGLDRPEVALAIVDGPPLTSYHAWHATRAELLRRLSRGASAAAAYDAAIAATDNTAERADFARKRDRFEFPRRRGSRGLVSARVGSASEESLIRS